VLLLLLAASRACNVRILWVRFATYRCVSAEIQMLITVVLLRWHAAAETTVLFHASSASNQDN